jgi:hypothetical protein
MPHAAKNTMAYATSEKCVSVDTRQNAKDEQDRRDESTCELGGLFPVRTSAVKTTPISTEQTMGMCIYF